MASKPEEGSSDSGSEEEMKNPPGSIPSINKTKKNLTTKAVDALKAVKRKMSPRKHKGEPLVDSPPGGIGGKEGPEVKPPRKKGQGEVKPQQGGDNGKGGQGVKPLPGGNGGQGEKPPPGGSGGQGVKPPVGGSESDYLRWASSSGTECMTDSTSLMDRSDSLYGVPEIESSKRRDSSKSCVEYSEEKPECQRTSSSKSEQLPSTQEE